MKKSTLKKWGKRLLWLLVTLGVLALIWFYGVKPLIAKIKGDIILPEDLATVKKETVEVLFKGSGTVTPKQDVKVTSKPSGILKAVYVKEGDYVKKGQQVGLIKPGKNEFEDYKPMPIYTDVSGTVVKCIGQNDYDKDFADKDLSLPRLGTYLSGTYDSAENATCFLRVVNMDTLVIPMYVPEMQILKIKKGMQVSAEISAQGKKAAPLTGKVTYISGQMEKTGRWGDQKAFLVIVELPRGENEILLGLNATISIVLEKHEDVLAIPSSALFEKNGKFYVFKFLGDNKTEEVEIEIGLSNDTLVEVTKGIHENDQVLTVLPYGESW